MTNTNFSNSVAAKVRELMGEGYEVRISEVTKNNNIKLTGLSIIPEGATVTPLIYLDSFEKAGATTDETAREVVRLFEENRNTAFDTNFAEIFGNKEKLLSRVLPKLVNANQDEELITYPFLDMKVAFYVEVEKVGSGKSTVTIRKQHTTATEKELFNAALKNIPETEFMTMGEMLTEMMGGVPFPCDKSMYIVTSKDRMFGAINILDGATMREIARKLNDDVIILPSSIHEVICVPAATGEGNPMAQLVREVNATQVAPNEVLSDNVYLYRRTSDSFEIKEV